MARSEMDKGSVAVQENLQGPMIFSSSVSDISFSHDGGAPQEIPVGMVVVQPGERGWRARRVRVWRESR